MFASAKHVAQGFARCTTAQRRLDGAARRAPRATTRRPTAICLRVCSQGARAMRDSMAAVMKHSATTRSASPPRRSAARSASRPGPTRNTSRCWSAAKKIGRPVYWMSGRSEAFLTDNHARDAYSDVELALDDKGKFLALRIRHLGAHGRLHRRGRRQHPDRQHDALPARHVRHQADRRADQVRVHQHRRRPRPIAAPAVRRRAIAWSAWSTRPRASPASTRSSCGGRT